MYDRWHKQSNSVATTDAQFERLIAAFPGSDYIEFHGFDAAWTLCVSVQFLDQ